jgi:hypothetical protein
LVQELAAVEREAEAMRAERMRREALLGQTDDAAVDRIISRTDSQLSEPESRRRQSTISHMKAAVAATRAEEETGAPERAAAERAADMARYRDDLARTMRPRTETDEGQPRRPVPAEARTQRPVTTQPPLVLVSEQRIDRPATPEIVRPRRVDTRTIAANELFDETGPATGGGFADFVAPMNLTTVVELIEAASAYVTEVEGQPEFTRPQVMRHVLATGLPMTQNRETLLRAFGQLMRDGRLRRSRRGLFELGGDSDFLQDARRVAETG